LRFDFSHQKPVSADELARIEDIANQAVLGNTLVETRQMAVDAAIQSGARALFGEKYGEEVRVVSMGLSQEPGNAGRAFSIELCGGTHVTRTGDIGLITVTGESAVASGVRRVEAKTGAAARRHLNERAARLNEVAHQLRAPEDELVKRLAGLIEERKKLERDLAEARKTIALGGATGGAGPGAIDIGGVKFLGKSISGVEIRDLKAIADEAKQSLGSGIVAIAGTSADGKAGIVVTVTPDLTAQFDAVTLVRAAAEALGGKGGGGRRDMAQAGGPNGEAAQAALDAVAALLRSPATAV
jgi:alanyl-tRNA synthetase